MSKTPPNQTPRPLHVLRALAETTARLVVRADAAYAPEPGEIQLLAGAYIESRDQLRALHDIVDQTDPNDPIGNALSRVGLARRPAEWTEPGPRLVPAARAPVQADQLVDLYAVVMGGTIDFTKHATFIVRLWDGMDGCWTDCTGDVSRDEALRVWAERTDGGRRKVSYSEIDYYAIFPGGTHMLWDGSEGGEMHR